MAARKSAASAASSDRSTGNSVLDAVLSQIRKEFGENAVMRMGEKVDREIPVISTGAVSLDLALGVGGLPRGRIVECYGHESSGKTTLALHVVANAQKEGGIAAFIDAEHALDPAYAKRIGVDVDNLIVSQPNSGEEALTICEQLAKSGEVAVIVVDSVAALTPQAEIDGCIGDAHVGLQARLMSQAMRKLTAIIAHSNTLVIFTNQIRDKIGMVFANPETTPGGKALKFYASCRLQVIRLGAIKNAGNVIIGNRVKVRVVKNKVAPPFAEAEFDIHYACGISYEGSLIECAVARGIIERRGSWLSYNGQQLGQGSLATTEFLKTHPEVTKEIVDLVKKMPLADPELAKQLD